MYYNLSNSLRNVRFTKKYKLFVHFRIFVYLILSEITGKNNENRNPGVPFQLLINKPEIDVKTNILHMKPFF